jgi:hypothetical protein
MYKDHKEYSHSFHTEREEFDEIARYTVKAALREVTYYLFA